MDDLEKIIRELKDRQDIRDVIMTYCKGVDRLDRALLESVYHPDALDDHGIFVGPADKFIDWVLEFHGAHQQRTLHQISTHLCELDGDVAHAESYFTVRLLNRRPPFMNRATGRYLDRFERRGGRWAIAQRVCVVDILDEHLDPGGDQGDQGKVRTARDRSDPGFARPLNVDSARFTV
jgi:hypothetical protein